MEIQTEQIQSPDGCQQAPRGQRLHIGIFGKRNVGKSSLLNSITNQEISIVSETAGTTTDVVQKPMELHPLGPVVFFDTAGLDDDDDNLGEARIQKTYEVAQRCDLAILVCDYQGWSNFELSLYKYFKSINVPVIAVINKIDICSISYKKLDKIRLYTDPLIVSTLKDTDIITKLKEKILENVPEDFLKAPSITENLINENDLVVLVIPIDKEAPKGRLILPQVQTIREILDKNAQTLIVKESQLQEALWKLDCEPKIVITDSQAFKKVNEIVPEDINLTSFSILFARLKGDIKIFIEGAKAIENLKDNDKILIYESCTHHAIEDDIAKVKIPNMLIEKTKKNLLFEYHSGCGFEENLEQYSLIIHCGGCMTNRREILNRIMKAQDFNIPITNYGLVIAYCQDILERATKMLLFKQD